MAQEPDYYTVLGILPTADEAAIRLAYRRLARRYHPDIAGPGSLERMQSLNAAYQVLGDPEQRRAYDERHGIAPTHPPAPARGAPTTTAEPSAAPVAPRTSSVRAGPGPLGRVATLEAPPLPIVALALSRDGTRASLGLIDGRVVVREVANGEALATLDFGTRAGVGVLQDVRLSPSGALAAAWGFALGLRIWRVESGQSLWNTAISAPSDLLDVALADDPAFACLALPDAPLALADEDPFRWAHAGRGGSAIYYRPLAGPILPAWANPLHSTESNGRFGRADAQGSWRVRARLLAANGRMLLTFAAATAPQGPKRSLLTLWELTHRTLRGAIAPRRVAQHSEPERPLGLPIAATPDLAWVAVAEGASRIRLLALGARQERTLAVGTLPEEVRLALSPDGRYLALARDSELWLWETLTGQPAQHWRFGGEVSALAFAPGGGRVRLGVGLANGLAEIWG
ncbi:MAG: J domain-containing protein [Ktedonobacterales bacterium]|nr:J domain-containing protein [Ktedonobacterales bacterium]